MSSEVPTPAVSVEDAHRSIEEGALLVDVREDDEWQAGHAPGAVHMPLGSLQDRYQELPRDRPIVAVCRMGGRSERATIGLRAEGFDVVNLTGGMQAWNAAGYPVQTDDGAPGTVI